MRWFEFTVARRWVSSFFPRWNLPRPFPRGDASLKLLLEQPIVLWLTCSGCASRPAGTGIVTMSGKSYGCSWEFVAASSISCLARENKVWGIVLVLQIWEMDCLPNLSANVHGIPDPTIWYILILLICVVIQSDLFLIYIVYLIFGIYSIRLIRLIHLIRLMYLCVICLIRLPMYNLLRLIDLILVINQLDIIVLVRFVSPYSPDLSDLSNSSNWSTRYDSYAIHLNISIYLIHPTEQIYPLDVTVLISLASSASPDFPDVLNSFT